MNRILALASLLLLPSCFAVTDLGKFSQAVQGNYSDLKVAWRGMDAHVNQYVEWHVVDASNVIQSRGIFKPLGGVDVSFFVPMAVPVANGPYRFDFWADVDGNGTYDLKGLDADHSWRIPLDGAHTNNAGQYEISFDHNFQFTDLANPAPLEIGKPATFHVTDLGAFANRRLEIRVSDTNSTHVVAFYRVPSLVEPKYDLVVPGMIEEGSVYTVSVYTDDGNGGAVRAFRIPATATAAGVDVSFAGTNPLATPGLVEVTDKNVIPAP